MLKPHNYYSLAFGLIFIVLAGFLSWNYGAYVKLSSQLEIYKILLTIAAIVFAIMGAWLSLLKVEIENGVEKATSNEEGNEYVAKARKLISPMSSSAIIIIVSLIYVFLYFTLKDIPDLHCYSEYFRVISLFLLMVLSAWQLTALIIVMFSGVDFLLNISRKNMDKRGDRNR